MGHPKGETEVLKKAANGGHGRLAACIGQRNCFMGSSVACASHACPHGLAVSSLLSLATAVSRVKDIVFADRPKSKSGLNVSGKFPLAS